MVFLGCSSSTNKKAGRRVTDAKGVSATSARIFYLQPWLSRSKSEARHPNLATKPHHPTKNLSLYHAPLHRKGAIHIDANVISTIVLAMHWSIIVLLSVRVIMVRPPVGVSLAWLMVIFSIPFFGAFLYLLFGERRLGRHRAERTVAVAKAFAPWQADLRREHSAKPTQVNPGFRHLAHQAERVLGFSPEPGNSFELFDNFQTVFDSLVRDIDNAQSICHMCFYIWHEGGRADDVIAALERAAQRGVECRILADGIGSKKFLESKSIAQLRKAGVEVVTALPIGLIRTLFVRRDLRNHRKIVDIDNAIAYTGSQNLVDPRFFKQDSGVGEWVDAVVRITGPVAVSLGGVFAQDWAVETKKPGEPPSANREDATTAGDVVMQVVPSGPDRHPDAIHQLLLTSIYAAQRSIVMTTPYFVPDDATITALLSAALRGVDVTLIVPARNDSILVRYASVAHFDDLMSAGVRIAAFKGGLLHTKSLAIDGAASIFGSVNLDMRSLWLNFEISLFVYDESFNARLTELHQKYLADSDWMDLEEWRRRPFRRKFAENTFRLIGPLL